MIEWIIQAAPLRKPLQLKNMNDQSLLLSVNEITHYFKKWTTGSGVLKKIYFLYKNVMFQIDPLKSSFLEINSTPKELYVKSTPKEQLSGEAVLKVTLASAIVYNCSSKIFTILYE